VEAFLGNLLSFFSNNRNELGVQFLEIQSFVRGAIEIEGIV